MSYGFAMMFKEVNNFEEAMKLSFQFTNTLFENSMEYLNQCIYYIPSNRIYIPKKDDNDSKELKDIKFKLEKSLDMTNEYWLYQLFNFNFVYWEKYHLLGVLGDRYPQIAKDLFDVEFYFQNSTDQNYEYKQWGNISCFQKVIKEVKTYSPTQIYEYRKGKLGDNMDEDEWDYCKKNVAYLRKSIVYDKIFNMLELNNWLYDKPSNLFERFSFNAITSIEKQYKLQLQLMKIKKEMED